MNRRSFAERLGLTAYGVMAGICASVLGAWAASGISGGAGAGVWIGVTVALALAAAWFADRVIVLAGRFIRLGLDRFPALR
jgi:hypothetical protein